jgi:hypothetical protein
MADTLIPAWVPADIASRLTIEELAPDEKRIRRALKILETTLGHYVAAYVDGDSSHVPVSRRRTGLCAFFEPAPLTRQQFAIIRDVERRHSGVVFVAYHRPLIPRRHLRHGIGAADSIQP